MFMQDTTKLFKMVLMPRYTFKSSICTIGYSLWRMAKEDSIRILIYSDATQKAEAFLTSVKNHITGLDKGSKFRSLFGNWETDPKDKDGTWNMSQIIVRSRLHAHAEPTVDTGGIETSKVGMHYDLIIFDDIVSDKNVTTKDQMDKVAECYRKSLSLLKPGGEVVVVGTRWHFGDLYGRILVENEESDQFGIFIRKAELKGADRVGADNCFPFSKIGLTEKFLQDQKRQQGSYLVSCLYQNDPVSADNQTFKPEDFTFYQPDTIPANLYITCCLDPAISQSKDADESAITVVGTDSMLNLYLLDIVSGQLLPDQVVDHVFRLHSKWKFSAFGIETNAFQKMLRRDIENRIQLERQNNPTFRFFQITEFKGTAQKTKEMRIRALQPYHERGALKFPGTRLETLLGKYQDLAYQMLQFPHAPHDDILDSLAYHIPIHRKGMVTPEYQEIPYSSAAWMERRQRKIRIEEWHRTPRWKRDPLPTQLAFS